MDAAALASGQGVAETSASSVPVDEAVGAIFAGAFVKVLSTDGVDVQRVAHRGRHRPAVLDTAIFERDDYRCQRPGCDASARLQVHHYRRDFAKGGPTAYWNLVHPVPLRPRPHHDGRSPDRGPARWVEVDRAAVMKGLSVTPITRVGRAFGMVTSGVERIRRNSARVIVLDEHGRVFLFRVQDPTTDAPAVWLAPGGGIEDGEDIAAAASRELFEETGVRVTPAELGAPVAVTRGSWEFRGRAFDTEDWYFATRVVPFEVDKSGWEDLEHELHNDWRWWTSEELDAAVELIIPAGLAQLLRELHRSDCMADLVDLPWVKG